MNPIDTRNHQLEADDQAYIWHPFTQMQEWADTPPLIIEKGEGNFLIDIYGNRYLDGVSSLWTNVHGHRKAAVDQAVKDQLDRIAHSTLLGLSNVPAVEFARQLVQVTPPGLDRVFYSDNGSTAVEIALKMAFQFQQQAGNTRKTRFLGLKNAYHGDTIGSVSVGGIDLFHEIYRPLLFDCFKAESPYCYRCPLGKSFPECGLDCLNSMEDIMRRHGEEIAALVIEPLVQGAAGILVQPPGYLKQARELCTQYNILMIADEVAVGFGKTGTLFACEQEGVVPDLLALAKGISAGYLPLAATLATQEIFDGFLGQYAEFKAMFHGHTYTGNPLACAAAIANLNLFQEERVMEQLQGKIERLTQGLAPLADLPHVGDIRQKGVMVGIELVADKSTKAEFPPENRTAHRVIMEARRHGVMIRPLGDVVILMPPLSIRPDEIDTLCRITGDAIRTVTQG